MDLTLIIASVAVPLLGAVAYFKFGAKKQATPSSPQSAGAKEDARVIELVPAMRGGKGRIQVDGKALDAMCDSPRSIPSGAVVDILSMIDEHTALIAKREQRDLTWENKL